MSEDRFAACLAEVLRHEGGYADNPADPGGATNMGITRRTLAAWRGVSPWTALPKGEVQALGAGEAEAIYRAQYWTVCRAGDLPAGLDLAVFDYAVNSGPARAVKALQALLGVAADGIAGPVTLAAVAHRDCAGLVDALCDQRLAFLSGLSSFATFGAGWRRRVEDIRAAALADITIRATDNGNWTMNFLANYKTYLVAAAMLVAGAAQVLGVDIPSMEGHSAGQLILEACAVIFLRREIKTGA